MFRLISYLFLMVILITIVRNVIGFLARLFVRAMQASNARQTPPPPASMPLTGELKKDPVCGTYTAAASSIQETVAGRTFYFCSAECRDKFALQTTQRR